MTPALTIRFAMLLGVLLFGGVILFVTQAPDWRPSSTADPASLVRYGQVIWGVAIAGALAVGMYARRAGAKASSLGIIGWAMGETTALYGAVYWFLTGSPRWYLSGVAFMVMTFVVFPARKRA